MWRRVGSKIARWCFWVDTVWPTVSRFGLSYRRSSETASEARKRWTSYYHTSQLDSDKHSRYIIRTSNTHTHIYVWLKPSQVTRFSGGVFVFAFVFYNTNIQLSASGNFAAGYTRSCKIKSHLKKFVLTLKA